MNLPFLLEIGTEEIPDWMIEPALNQLRDLFTTVLSDHRLDGHVTSVDATPRRIVLRADNLLPAQPDETRTISGPPVSTGEGAARGFAKKNGIAFEELTKLTTPKGEYWSYEKHVPGRRTAEVLAEVLPGLIAKIYFPKTMYWTGKGGVRFIRPIRWLVALLGEEVVPFEIAGVRSGNTTEGHRVLGNSAIAVTIETYEKQLRDNYVLLSAEERQARIETALGDGVARDEALLKTLVYLTEFPTPIRGKFSADYLQLPREILVTVMRHHQRYFSVNDAQGNLAPEFVAVMNTAADPEGLVRHGNERVLKARFNDARFFWGVDMQRKLSERIDDLKAVTFQAKLGSYHEKMQRIIALAKEIAAKAKADVNLCARAAELAKVDLTTEMVKEFTDLQGVVGGLYAREQGEPEEVAKAIYDHYKPVGADDSIPSTLTGQVVALADKCDTLKGCFAIGLIPTGSRDPFALRRAAQGVVKIIVEGGLRLKLGDLLGDNAQLREFMQDRIRYYFRDVRGFAYDEVNAILAAGSDDLVDVAQRLDAIRAVRATADFEPVAASFKRITNILEQAKFTGGTIDSSLLTEPPEQNLNAALTALKQKSPASYADRLSDMAGLRPVIDTFFDKVLVNAQDERVRQNRLALLSSLLSEFSTIADFSEIVVTTQ
jgi:glycyl-tRNA synthetase beta chain